MIPTKEDILKASARIKPYVHRTPVFASAAIAEMAGARLFFKCENLQKTGSFKIRGACNAIFSLSADQRKNGIVAHSSGNHAQAAAYAARLAGIAAYIVMPENASRVKAEAVKAYGGQITFCAPTLKAREETAQKIIEETGAVFIPPYNDYAIIAGQATAAMELLDEVSDLDLILAPVGGGGLLSGTSLSAKYFSAARVIGCEPAGADDAFRSLKAGRIIPSENPDTIADGLLTSLGEKTFGIIRENVDKIFSVSDKDIFAAMRLVWERMKLVVEPSAAVPLAAALRNQQALNGKKTGIILSGGNFDVDQWEKTAKRSRI